MYYIRPSIDTPNGKGRFRPLAGGVALWNNQHWPPTEALRIAADHTRGLRGLAKS